MVKIRNGNFWFSSYLIKILCLSGILGLEVTITSREADDLSLNMTGPVFFSNGKYSVSKKLPACSLSAQVLSA